MCRRPLPTLLVKGHLQSFRFTIKVLTSNGQRLLLYEVFQSEQKSPPPYRQGVVVQFGPPQGNKVLPWVYVVPELSVKLT